MKHSLMLYHSGRILVIELEDLKDDRLWWYKNRDFRFETERIIPHFVVTILFPLTIFVDRDVERKLPPPPAEAPPNELLNDEKLKYT